jgi:hypothetical protein
MLVLQVAAHVWMDGCRTSEWYPLDHGVIGLFDIEAFECA